MHQRAVGDLLSQFSQGCEDFHFLLRVHVSRQLSHDDVSVHLHKMGHKCCSAAQEKRNKNALIYTPLLVWSSAAPVAS